MALLAPYFISRFMDGAAPAAGYRLWTYESGTTTPKTSYTSSDAGTPNTNPIVLDENGECALWLGSGSYSLKLETPVADGSALVKQWDEVSAIDNLSDLAATDGVDLVGFDPSLGYSNTLGQWLQKDVNVFRWIPPAQWAGILAGTSTYDASASIASALAAAFARAPCRLVFPAGRYKCDSVLGVIDGTNGNVAVELNGSTLDFSGVGLATSTTILDITGTYAGTPIALSSNAAAAQKTVACVSSTFAAGDMVRVYSDTVWDSLRTSSKYGEINWVETVPDAASVTLVNDLASTYTTADSAKIEKLTPCENVTIRNGTIQGPSGNDLLAGIKVRLGNNVRIEAVNFFDLDITHVQLLDCTNSKVIGCHFEETNATATGYGLSFADATQDCVAMGNTFENVRHSLSTNNSPSTSWGITRRILFHGNVVTDSAETTGGTGGDAIDTHAGSEDIFIIDNIVNSSSGTGINSEGRSAVIRGNQVYNSAGNGITHQNYSDVEGEVVCSDNTVRIVSGNYGIVLVPNSAGYKSATVSGNNVKSATTGIRLVGSSGKVFYDLSVTGNTVVNTATNAGIELTYVNNGSVSGNSVQTQAIGIVLDTCQDVAVSGNSVRLSSTGTTGYGYRVQGTSIAINVNGNTAYNAGGLSAAAGVSFVNTTVTYSKIANNIARAMTAGTVFAPGTGTGNVASDNITAP